MADDAGFGSGKRLELYPYDAKQATSYLTSIDPSMGSLIKIVGRFDLQSRAHLTPFQVLLRTIIYQQISVAAATSIEAKVKKLFPGYRPSAKRFVALSDDDLRRCGMSKPKIKYGRDLAEKCLSQHVPSRSKMGTLTDECVIETLCQINGIGKWSAQVILIFYLLRPDVLPITDLGIRRGYMFAYRMKALPNIATLEKLGEAWRPFRSVASWYLWRAAHLTAQHFQ